MSNLEKLAQQLLPNAALQCAMEHPIATTAHGATIYAVAPGWENEELRTDPLLKKVADQLTLENALRQGLHNAFYIPRDAALPLALLCSVLERNGSNAAIFMEQP